MSLAVRLLLGLAFIALFVTAVVGLSAREVSRQEVERGFRHRIGAAVRGAQGEIIYEAGAVTQLLPPLCKHDTFVDRTLVDLEGAKGKVGELPLDTMSSLQTMVPAQAKALRLDRLRLVTGDGIILGTTHKKEQGDLDTGLATRLHEKAGRARVVRYGNETHIEIHCTRSSPVVTKKSSVTGKKEPLMVGLVASRRVKPILERISRAYGVMLALDPADLPSAGPGFITEQLTIDELPGLTVHAAVSRQPLFDALAQIDSSMLLSGAIGILLSVALAVLLARGLSRPIVELAHQTRAVIHGEPRPVKGRGARELKQLAQTFNRTIEELTAMRKRLARTERIAARREVARQVAHEIKNPLSPIRASIENLRRLRDRNSAKFETYFDEATKTVLEEVHRIKTIVSEFTKFARMPPPRFARIDLEDMIRSVASIHDTPAAGTGEAARVKVDVEPVADVMADRDQLVQVVTNLVQNGIEAARDAGTTPSVTIRLYPMSARDVCLEVDDNGPGIDPAVRERIFEPYVTTKKTGNGLGLAIVQTILHEHGGEIMAGEAPGGGARLILTLPVDGPPLLEKAPHSSADPPGELPPS